MGICNYNLEDILESTMSELHAIILTMPFVQSQHFFTTRSLTTDLLSSSANIEYPGPNSSVKDRLRKPIQRVFNDLQNSGVVLKHRKRDLKDIKIPSDKSIYVYEFNDGVNFNYLNAMLALNFTSKTGISVYDILSRHENEKSKGYDLESWVKFLSELNETFTQDGFADYRDLQYGGIPESTLKRRVDKMTKLGFFEKERVAMGVKYKVCDGFQEYLENDSHKDEQELRDNLPNKGLTEFTRGDLASLISGDATRITRRMLSANVIQQTSKPVNKTELRPTDKFKQTINYLINPILSSFDDGDNGVLLNGLNDFLEEGKLVFSKYWRAVHNSFETYKKSNPNVREI